MSEIEDIGFGVTINRFNTDPFGTFGGVIIEHDSSDECLFPGTDFGASAFGRCAGVVYVTDTPNRPRWIVVEKNPLTLSPSIECKCKGFHGHVVDGRWVPV